MAIDEETVQSGLEALSVAVAELMEDMNPLALGLSWQEPGEQAQQIAMLRQVGQDIAALATAAEVLIRHGQPDQ